MSSQVSSFTPAPVNGDTFSRHTSRYSLLLRSYFNSGWAFFLPYLLAYLLYAWLKWPVNQPLGAGSGENGAGIWVPCLLHVYWAFHAVHLAFGALALRSWWRIHIPNPLEPSAFSFQPSAFWPLLPWFCLALVFYIPGIYLEWPSDPWEHLRRINEWHVLQHVTDHSSWQKSSYFLPYSVTGHVTGLTQLSWLNCYYTAVCLLLSWQYYRLARAVGLGERAAFIFVLLNAVTFGNNIFSFYRYYGLSSSILAQLGAVTLTRIALEILSVPNKEQGTKSTRQKSDPPPAPQSPVRPVTSISPSEIERSVALPANSRWKILSRSKGSSLLAPHYSLLRSLIAALALLLLIAFNHIQGLGIAGLGVLAVAVWRLIEWRRSMIVWLALAAVALSVATILWFPRHPALDEVYRPQGWLTPWYGFNLFMPASPASERTFHILGLVGLLSLPLGLWLIVSKNHITGWLTLLPILALPLPCFALPFAHGLTIVKSVDNIVTFHRMLFAFPMGLALVAALVHALPPMPRRMSATQSPHATSPLPTDRSNYPLVISMAGLFSVITLSSGGSAFNRFWNCVQSTPSDLQLHHLLESLTPTTIAQTKDENTLLVDTLLVSEVYECFAPTLYLDAFRPIGDPLNSTELERRMAWLVSLSGIQKNGLLPRVSIAEPPAGKLRMPFQTPGSEFTSRAEDFSPLAASWTTLSGPPHQSTVVNGVPAVSNQAGAATDVFNSEFIPVSSGKRYQLTSGIRQLRGAPSRNYLAVIWYDREKRLLASTLAQPAGAGNPAGWSNGAYSYYGLVGQPAPTVWRQYTIDFGIGTRADIPANAAFIRVGALLNYRATPNAQVALGAVMLRTILIQQHLARLPNARRVYSPISLTACLSKHWPPQRVALDHAGTKELCNHLPSFRPSGALQTSSAD